jgi:hypothetical protein
VVVKVVVVVVYHCDDGDEEDTKDTTREDHAFLERRCRRTDIIRGDFCARFL